MAYVLYRGEYDKRRDDGEARHAGRLARRCRAESAQEPAGPGAVAAAARSSADRARDRQSLLAGSLRHGPGPHDAAISASPANCRRIPNCSTGWPSNSATQGWDVKKFFKLMVTSATYRQAATTTPEKLEKDPQNRLLSRGPRFRMDAEMVRDYALAASGLLVRKIGGPSVKPYQPEGRLGSGGDDRQQHARLHAATPAKTSIAAACTLLEARGAAGLDGHLQCAEPRDLHRAPRAHQHAAAGAGDPERSAVRRGGPPSGATDA